MFQELLGVESKRIYSGKVAFPEVMLFITVTPMSYKIEREANSFSAANQKLGNKKLGSNSTLRWLLLLFFIK